MAETRSMAASRPPIRSLMAAGYADFWRLWTVGLVVFVVRWLETVAVAVVVYERTDSAFLVAMMTMLRLLPMGLLGAFLGAWAERIERRATLIGVVVLMGLNSLILCVLAYQGQLEVWHLAVTSALNGLGWATDNPVRRVMIGDSVGAERMGTAMSLDVGASNASRMVGPTVGGFVLAHVGIDGVFAVSVVLYVLALVAAWRVRYRNAATTPGGSVLARISEGLRMVRGDRRLVGILVVTVIFNVFAWPFTSMIPVIGRDQLLLGPEGVGVLASMDGIGSFAGAVLLALLARPAWYGRTYCWGVLIYMVMLTVFALSPEPGLAGATLVCTGLGQAGFATMQATLVYLAAPPEMRSRILGVLSVCIGTAPIGFVWIGGLAEAFGANWATVITGVAGLCAMAATWPLWRRI
ncbi:MAG: MFS transporter [Acetobacteraceae bacterium]